MRKTLEAIGLIALVVLVWLTYQALAGPTRLPDRIPTHFDAAGNPNGWGSPAMLMLLPIVAIGLHLGITVVSRIPSAFHYPVRVTRVSLPRIQCLTLEMITCIKAELACLFATLQWWMIQAARNNEGQLPPLLMPGFIVLIFGTIGGYLFAVIRAAGSGTDSN